MLPVPCFARSEPSLLEVSEAWGSSRFVEEAAGDTSVVSLLRRKLTITGVVRLASDSGVTHRPKRTIANFLPVSTRDVPKR
jgi:hypothetical protein